MATGEACRSVSAVGRSRRWKCSKGHLAAVSVCSVAYHLVASHRIASHRIASHRIASHRISLLYSCMVVHYESMTQVVSD